MLLAGAVVLLLVFVCLSLFVYFTRPVLFDVQSLGPREAWIAWEQMQGALDRQPSPDERAFFQMQRTHGLWWFPVGVVGLVGLGLLVAGALLRRRAPIGK